ncbi:MAG: hypothetical protein LBU88_00355 [Treponema sp.]|jgi:hypothetical protein|nr:hypothetical protein [Treponema sp.]
MADLFEREEQHNLFRLPERPEHYKPDPPPNPIAQTQIDPAFRLPESVSEYSTPDSQDRGTYAAEMFQQWREGSEQRREFSDQLKTTHGGTGLSGREIAFLYDMRERGHIDDGEIFKIASSKELGDFIGIDPGFVYNFYDEMWAAISNDRENRFARPQSRWEAINNSIQMAKNSDPLGEMGNRLSALHGQIKTAYGTERDELQKQADELWQRISAIREENERLSRGMPTDALSFILTTTIQSAPYQLRTITGGIKMGTYFGAGSAVVGAAAGSALPGVGTAAGAAEGFVRGFAKGYSVGAFEAGSREMAGTMYIEMIAAGMEQNNARLLSIVGGGINGLIESSLGVVAGAGKSMVKNIAGRTLSQEAQKRIAAAAANNFVSRLGRDIATSAVGKNIVTRTLVEFAKNTVSEGIEEGLQYMVEQAMLAIGDAMQDDPVERNMFMDPQYKAELEMSILGGLAGGLGFGIMGLPLTISGNAATTAQQITDLRELALNISDKEDFRTAARNSPLTGNLSDADIDNIHTSVQTMREAEEATRTEELRQRRLYGSIDQSGEIHREGGGNLYGELSRHVESGGMETGEYVIGSPKKSESNAYAVLEYEKRGDRTEVTGFNIGEAYEGLQEEILQNFANEMGTEINFDGKVYAPVEGAATARRFGFAAEKASGAASARTASGFSFSKQQYTAQDTKADTSAKQSFARQIREAGTQVKGAQVETIVDFYDQVGRKWFGMGFEKFMNRMALNPDQFVTKQDMTDAQIGEWYRSKYSAQELAARGIDLNNLTEEQRQAARESVKGFATPGMDGITKSITAAKNADISTFIHEGIHAFTNLAKAMDPELYQEMMRAAGLDNEVFMQAAPEQQEFMLRDAWEKLAHQMERYLYDGIVSDPVKDLFKKLAEFLKGIVDVLDSRKELSPEIKKLYDELFKDTAQETRQDGSTERSGVKSERSGANIEQSGVKSEQFDIYQDEYDKVISDKSKPLEERSEAAVHKAQMLFSDELLAPQDRKHRATAELIKQADKIPDEAQRKKVIADIRRLRDMYKGTAAEYKAPNGNNSLLLESLGEKTGQQAWYAVRTESFKEWFGDWERAARVEAIENIEAIKVKAAEHTSQKEAESIIRTFGQEPITNKNDDRKAIIPVNTIGKLYGHKGYNITKIIKEIPALYETSKHGWSESERVKPGHKVRPNVKEYHNYINKFNDGAGEYFIRFTLHEEKTRSNKPGKNYIHSAAISNIEIYKKGDNLQQIREKSTGETSTSPFIDLRLVDFFNSVKENVSKVVDKNGEPQADIFMENAGAYGDLTPKTLFQTAWHGTANSFTKFDNSMMGSGVGKQLYGWGHYFTSERSIADWYKRSLSNVYNKQGRTYEVDIPGDEVFLDWGKSIDKQPEAVQKVLDRLITWDENGKSKYHYQYNIRKLSDGYQTYKTLADGKIKYDTLAEAQAAVKSEIKKHYTGGMFYTNLAATITPKKASLLLDHLGVKGTKYFDRGTPYVDEMNQPVAEKGAYNYVIYGDSDINILQTFFQDDEFEAFMNDYPGVVKHAASFESAEDLAAYYGVFGEMPETVLQKANDAGYFDRIYKEAKGEPETGTIPEYDFNKNISAKKIVAALRAYGVSAADALEAVKIVRNEKGDAVSYLEELGVSRIDAEAYIEHSKVFSRQEMLQMEKDAKLEHEAEPKTETVKLGTDNEAAKKYFESLHESAKEIHSDLKQDSSLWENMEAELAGEGRTAEDFINWFNTDKGFDDLLLLAAQTEKDGEVRGETEAETRRNKAAAAAARAAFNKNNPNWDTAFKSVLARKKVDEKTKKILRGMIRNRPLQYMEAWAVMSGDDTWLPNETDAQKIKRLDTSGMVDEEYLQRQSPEELERIGRQLGSERIRQKIQDGSLRFDDPDMDSYEQQLKKDQSETQKKIEKKKEDLSDYKELLQKIAENEKRHQMIVRQTARNTTDAGIAEIKKERKKLAEVQADYRRAIQEMEYLAKDLNITQRNNYQEFRRLLREQTEQQEQLQAVNELREIKKRDMRMVLRRVDLKTVHVTNAANIKWVQSHFDSYQLAAKWVGPGAKSLQQLYNQFITDDEYRDALRKRLGGGYYTSIERTIYKDIKTGDTRAYSELSAEQRRRLKRALLDNQSIFEELGIDIDEDRKRYSPQEYAEHEAYMKDFIPADLLVKMQGLMEDENGNRRTKMEDWTVEDMQRLAGVVSNLRREGRENEQARKEARKQLLDERMSKTLKVLKANMPKGTSPEDAPYTAGKKIEEEKMSGRRGLFYSVHNARRFFRRLEGHKDGYLYDSMTRAEYDAFNKEWGHALARREKVAEQFKKLGIKETDLVKYQFEIWDAKGTKKATLDEMLSLYYAQYNERAFHAVVFGNFASVEDRKILKDFADNKDLHGQMNYEAEIAKRYWNDMKKLEDFFAREGNEKYRKVMDIIGNDYDENYQRLKDFVAREYNEELGSEGYYMPLQRLGVIPKTEEDTKQALADSGLSPHINRGFTKGRVDIPSFEQQAVRIGLFNIWDSMVQKQEHLMAYDSLMKQTKQVFEGDSKTSEQIRAALRGGWSEESIKYIKKWTSELAAPPVNEDVKNLNKVHRILRGHFPAAMLGWRVASILKQAIESPPPFFQFVNPGEYSAAAISCLSKETRDMIYEKSTYLKVRYFDPAMAVMKNMEKAYLAGNIGKAEAAFAKFENIGMKGQEWIDTVCVIPGWLAAYKKKLAELNRTVSDNKSEQQIEKEAVHYADQVVRDCQPSSVLMDQALLMKGDKNPFYRMLQQFQTPIVSIFQQLFIDTPINFRNGRILEGLWTWAIYALIAITIGAMRDDEDEKFDPKNRAIDALVMPLEMIPMAGGQLSYWAESYIKTGKARTSSRGQFPVVESVLRTGNAISDEDWAKAGWNALEGFMYLTGGPVAAKRDIEKAVEEENPWRILGIK